jgi:hypothetical protein
MNGKIMRMATVKKTWLIDPELVRHARRISGSRTETETVTRALQEMVVRDQIDKAFKRNSAVLADLEVVFPDPPPRRRSR